MIAHHYEKLQYLSYKQRGECPIARAKNNIELQPTELHHRYPRTKLGLRRFPLFIDSVWNLMAVSHRGHMEWGSYGRIKWGEAERRERFLERHPAIARAVNME